MKGYTKPNTGLVGFVTVLACIVLAGSLPAFAVPPSQLFRINTNSGIVTFTGTCCFSWNESVAVTEPLTVTPVVVTFSADYQSSGENFVGISLNGQACNFYGAGRMPMIFPIGGGTAPYSNISLNWVIYPSDGLVSGKNTFALCGGGSFGSTVTTTLGYNTLSVRISK